jgi:hypothetical protein
MRRQLSTHQDGLMSVRLLQKQHLQHLEFGNHFYG